MKLRNATPSCHVGYLVVKALDHLSIAVFYAIPVVAPLDVSQRFLCCSLDLKLVLRYVIEVMHYRGSPRRVR